ncbi:MAG: uroporphyrinogen-III C-methyltransferase [Myxococcales bacterium]|nr:uroporphyrinogen-III C-methyltransferase [Myxococcales bacterium]
MIRRTLGQACLALALLVGVAHAASTLADAQGLVNMAAERFRDGDFAAALTALQEAEPIVAAANDPSVAQIRFNIARCLEELGRDDEALAAWQVYLRVPDATHRKQRAVAAVTALKKRIYGALAVSCEPVGAAVKIEGLLETAAPCPFRREDLKPGVYKVHVAFDGYSEGMREVEVVAGETAAASFRLEALPVAGGLVVPPMEAPPPATNPWPWVLIGTGVVAAGGGAFLTTQAIAARDDAESLPPGDDRDGSVDDFETAETLSWVAYGVGAAAIAGGVVLWILDDPATPAGAGDVEMVPGGVRIRW